MEQIMPIPSDSPKVKLSLNLPEAAVKRVKIEVIERGKGTTEASIVLEALERHWAFAAKKDLIAKLRQQHLAKVPLHQMDFGTKLRLEEKLFLLDEITKEECMP